MRCNNCNYLYFDYSENYEDCRLGLGEENGKGECGCKYTQKQLDKFAKEIEEMEAEEYKRMGEFFSKLDNEVTNDMEND